jgi:hypothetical protein
MGPVFNGILTEIQIGFYQAFKVEVGRSIFIGVFKESQKVLRVLYGFS